MGAWDVRASRVGASKHILRIAKQASQQRDIWAHRMQHRGQFYFYNQPVRLPPRTKLGIRHAIVTGRYEAAECELIGEYLRPELPVIELGGCLGLVSRFISEHLDVDAEHLIVEANPALVEFCRINAQTERRRNKTTVLQKAVAYDTAIVRFHASTNAHTSRVGDGRKPGNVDVPACTLSELVAQVAISDGYTLVCDIEGAEYDMFEKDGDALAVCALALVEVHPDVFERQGRTLDGFLDHVRACGFQPIDHVDNVYAFARP